MLGLTRRLRRSTARTLLALWAGLWLFAAAVPCVMAASHCPDMGGVPCESMDMPANHALPAAADCDTLQAIDCQTANEHFVTTRAVTPDFQVLPPRLLTLPAAAAILPLHPALPQAERYVLRLSPPPLHLQLSVFLI
jgi:hypothetical protein